MLESCRRTPLKVELMRWRGEALHVLWKCGPLSIMQRWLDFCLAFEGVNWIMYLLNKMIDARGWQ